MEQTQTQKVIKQKEKQHIFEQIHRYRIIIKIAEILLLAILFSSWLVLVEAAPITEKNVEVLVNKERTVRGIQPLKINQSLNIAAQRKSLDMIKRDYFEHYAYGLTPWNFIINENYDYLYAGENLAMDFSTSEGMVSAWMDSPTHRKNILNPDFEEMGVGIVKGEYSDNSGTAQTTMVTNMFATKKPAVIRVFDLVVSKLKEVL